MGLRTALMKANQADLSRLLMKKDDDTKTEYERKLDMARSLVICTKERGGSLNEAKKLINTLMSQDVGYLWMILTTYFLP